MDIQLPKMSGIECVVRLKERLRELQIMMLTVYDDDELVFKSLVAGASGYILKKTPPSELLEAIRNLHNGGSPMSSQIARKVSGLIFVACTVGKLPTCQCYLRHASF